MARLSADMVFGAVVILLIAGVVFTGVSDSPTGQVTAEQQETLKPYVDMVSPDREAVIYNEVQEFLFRLQNVDYDANCQLLVNDEQFDSVKQVSGGQLGVFEADLPYGYHKWKVECKLLNGRTISSQEWSFTVERPEEMVWNREPVRTQVGSGSSGGSGNQVTGAVVGADSLSGNTGLALTLLIIGGLVWTVNLRRRQ